MQEVGELPERLWRDYPLRVSPWVPRTPGISRAKSGHPGLEKKSYVRWLNISRRSLHRSTVHDPLRISTRPCDLGPSRPPPREPRLEPSLRPQSLRLCDVDLVLDLRKSRPRTLDRNLDLTTATLEPSTLESSLTGQTLRRHRDLRRSRPRPQLNLTSTTSTLGILAACSADPARRTPLPCSALLHF
ncbi:hypothetical protein CRG98_025276 [Punica granatum]|uniref:Uncharacterized protein n=1 Tax=Punica granatum TaxID=22663 RepID=A0A2I0JEI9_PUNGR|nr:hypothetical protein CRG98_025276 [Punica granatum]